MMKLAIGIGILFLIALAVPVAAEGAIVFKDDSCAYWFPGYPEFGWAVGVREMGVSNPSGFSLWTCKGQLADGVTPPEKTITIYGEDVGVPCSTPLGLTLDWKEIITPSGQTRHNCYFRV